MNGAAGSTEMEMEMEMGIPSSLRGWPTSVVRPTGLSPSDSGDDRGPFFRGTHWPPAEALRSLAGSIWPDETDQRAPKPIWTAQNASIGLVAEFANKPGWGSINLDQYWRRSRETNDQVRAELRQLVELMPYRAGVLGEALAQREAIDDYFRGILTFTAASHPSTNLLVQAALRIGEFQVMYYKRRYNRPRPSQLCPLLMPPIEVPGHASFPSGHATQSHLVAHVLENVMPKSLVNLGLLRGLARRIARNREVLGLHYRSDSAAGEELGMRSFCIMRGSDTLNGLIEEARREWGRDPRQDGGYEAASE